MLSSRQNSTNKLFKNRGKSSKCKLIGTWRKRLKCQWRGNLKAQCKILCNKSIKNLPFQLNSKCLTKLSMTLRFKKTKMPSSKKLLKNQKLWRSSKSNKSWTSQCRSSNQSQLKGLVKVLRQLCRVATHLNRLLKRKVSLVPQIQKWFLATWFRFTEGILTIELKFRNIR